MMSEATQNRFAKAVLDIDQPVPDGLVAWTAPQAASRFAVYRNNVQSGLIRALSSRFPAAERLVGTAFFAAMAQAFVRQHPPRSPLLLDYGDDLADFVERFEPAASLAYLPDVIRLEAARTKAYHAPDATPLDPTTIAALPTDRLPALGLDLHPSASVVRSAYPIVTIWAMNVGETAVQPIDDWAPEEALVIRPHMTVLVHRLPAGSGAVIEALRSGVSLGAAFETALEHEPAFDLTAMLARALQSGLFTTFRDPREQFRSNPPSAAER